MHAPCKKEAKKAKTDKKDGTLEIIIIYSIVEEQLSSFETQSSSVLTQQRSIDFFQEVKVLSIHFYEGLFDLGPEPDDFKVR